MAPTPKKLQTLGRKIERNRNCQILFEALVKGAEVHTKNQESNEEHAVAGGLEEGIQCPHATVPLC